MKPYFLILPLFAFFSYSCKNETMRPNSISLSTKSFSEISLSPENPGNPYDTIGERHNLILAKVVPEICTSCKPDLAATAKAVTDATAPLQLKTPGDSYYDTVAGTVSLNTDQLISQLDCSIPAKEMLTELFSILRNSVKNSYGYSDLKGQIIQLENSVNTNGGLNESDKAVVLSACSVARFSSFYWGYSNPPVKSYSLKGITKWVAAATSDIAGAIVYRSAAYAADCSSYAYWLIVYSMPG
ncbi:hypothetical protein ACFFOO_01005 [Mucilaginibacter ginsenosidivorans]|uniref:Uncharacterized protein n=2 Tax=Mucilaginibacter ginsenosidivorans TaxID=398053 RepID=A0A5B8US40_9SPHI|nr:hypothetical protein FRZ54_04680 [Mucilaginibacter ginsenosidivorans]